MYEPFAAGFVIDISLRRVGNERLLDLVKKELVRFLGEQNSGEDLFYFYHPQQEAAYDTPGKAVAFIAGYETDGYSFPLEYPLKQTLYVLAAANSANRKHLFYLSDRLSPKSEQVCEKIRKLSSSNDFGVQLHVIDLNQTYGVLHSTLQAVVQQEENGG